MNEQDVNKIIDKKLDSMTNLAVPFHLHNGWDVNQLDPATALLGFPVLQVADASVAPTDTPLTGTFRFQVDVTPDYYLWTYTVYSTALGVLTGAWKSIVLSSTGIPSPLTTKGDIYTYSTVNDRLAVGTNGQILFSDSTASTGLKWGTASTSVLITRDMTAASGAVVTAHGLGRIPNYLRITGYVVGASGMTLSSFGTYQTASNTNKSIYFSNVAGAPAAKNTGQVIALVPLDGTDYQIATAAVDITNVTLTWTKVGAPTTIASIIIESF